MSTTNSRRGDPQSERGQTYLGNDSEPDWNDVAAGVREREWQHIYGYQPRRAEVPLATGMSDPAMVDRARRYVATMSPSIQGSNGSGALFKAAQAPTRGFRLEHADALRVLAEEFNPRCAPPWTLHELRRAVRSASRRGRMPIGALADKPLERRPTS